MVTREIQWKLKREPKLLTEVAQLTHGKPEQYAWHQIHRQVNYKPTRESAEFRPPHARENPQVLGLALAVHHYSRNKMLMDLPSAHDYCGSYGCTLLVETALANAVVENTREFEGLYVPPFLRKGAFVFFAIDNRLFRGHC